MIQRLFVFAVVCSTLMVVPSQAQQNPSVRSAAVQTLPTISQAQVVDVTDLLSFQTEAIPGGRRDVNDNVLRAAYRIGRRVQAATPEAAANTYLSQAASQFGWDEAMDDLQQVSVKHTPRSTHIVYQQFFFGVPVYQRQVKVNLNAQDQPTMVISGYAPHLRHLRTFDPQPRLSETEAQGRAQAAVSQRGAQVSDAKLVVVPDATPRLAWQLLAWPDDAPAEWDVLVDAHTGEVLRLVNQATHAWRGHESGSMGGWESGSVAWAAEDAYAPGAVQVDGSGLVFDPDPLTTAGVTYGGAYTDASDADVAELNAERIEVVLNDLTQGNDGLYRLEGPFARVDGTIQSVYTPPAEADPNAFHYTRADQHFEAVMVYYHLDKSQRYLQSLTLGHDVQNGPIRVNPHGLGGADNSQYLPGSNVLVFGDGGIDDAEDADVIWHEYGHALLESGSPGLLGGEGIALHEGWSDYWAASYSRMLEETGQVPVGDWRKVFTWDGNQFWNGRRLDVQGHYPEALTGQPHTDGLIWATTMMQVYDDLGRTVTDRLNLLSHPYLSSPVTLADAAEAVIQADRDFYGGIHVPVLLQYFGDRGLVDPTSFGPTVAHTPMGYIAEAGPEVVFEATITTSSVPVAEAWVFYGLNGAAPTQQVALFEQGAVYQATLDLADDVTSVTYYLEATDTNGLTVRLPSNAPTATYTFSVGPDTEAPEVVHTPLTRASSQAWPPQLVATVTDNQGVGSVTASFAIKDSDGNTVFEDTFALTHQSNGIYAGSFTGTAGQLPSGATVEYYLVAQDVAAPVNETMLPASGVFSFPVLTDGVVASYDFEASQGTATGAWAHGAPLFLLETAHSGERLWGTGLEEAYPGFVEYSTLELPGVNLNGFDDAYLIFWHWYDIEHNGGAGLGGVGPPILWDGANVKASVNGGQTWTLLQPEDGYTATISGDAGNPMGNEEAWGGYSYGWQRVVVPLPTGPDVRVRFDFGTDISNTEEGLAYAGWFIDDVSVSTIRPQDTTAPVVQAAPADLVVRPAGQLLPELVVETMDETGVAFVQVQYQYSQSIGVTSGTERLPMDFADVNTFRTILPLPEGEVGDFLEYRFTLRDADGNQTTYPNTLQDPLRVEFRLVETQDVLPMASPTGDWAFANPGWQVQPTGNDAVSSLVLQPLDLPTNADVLQFVLNHRFGLDSGLGGNVKVSTDGGTTWTVLEPEGGYPITFAPGGNHPMHGERVFTGSHLSLPPPIFDLMPYTGQQVRLRLDLGAVRPAAGGEFWAVDGATLTMLGTTTTTEGFDIPRTLALHPNFPDPVVGTTTISYTLPQPVSVALTVYDVLGRQVAMLVDGEQPVGTHTVKLDASGFANGVYLLRLVAGGTQQTERMIVTH